MLDRMASESLALPLNNALIGLVAALAVGLIVGLERGWHGRELPEGSRVAGLRTFALIGLFGGVSAQLREPFGAAVLAAGLVCLGLLGVVSYAAWMRSSGRLSATSSIAALLTCVLGALAASGAPVLAVGTAVVVAVPDELLGSRLVAYVEAREPGVGKTREFSLPFRRTDEREIAHQRGELHAGNLACRVAPQRIVIVLAAGSTRMRWPVRMSSSAFRVQPSVIGSFASTAPCTITGLSLPKTSARGAMPLCRRSLNAHPPATPPLVVGMTRMRSRIDSPSALWPMRVMTPVTRFRS